MGIALLSVEGAREKDHRPWLSQICPLLYGRGGIPRIDVVG